MRDIELNPHTRSCRRFEEHLHLMMPPVPGRELRLRRRPALVFKLAPAPREPRGPPARSKRADLFSAVFEETQGCPGVDPAPPRRRARACSVSRLTTRMRDIELRDERLKKRFELPPFLKHFATNLNLAGAAGQGAARLRPRQGNPAGARNSRATASAPTR